MIELIRQWWATMTITPAQAQECAQGLEALGNDVHKLFNSLETPEQAISRINASLGEPNA